MAQTPNTTQRIDIGDYRKLRLHSKPNELGYWELWFSDATRGFATRKHSTRCKDLVQAQAYFNSFCADRQAEILATTPYGRPATVDQLCQLWLDAVLKLGKATTGKHVLASIRRELGHYTADQLTRKMLRDYGTGYAETTIRRNLGALRTVLIWAADEGLISRDDVPVFKKVLPPEGPPRTLFLDAVREAWFWAEAQRWSDPRVGLFVAIGLDTAARREAILDLTWDRVDFGLGTIDFVKPGRRVTKKTRVRVPIAKRLMPVLKEAWLRAPKDAAGRASGPVIGSRDIGRVFRRFTHAIGAPEVTPHIMRHTWGSLRAMAGMPLYDIARGMGDTIVTIEKTYLHLTPDHLKTVFKA